MDDDDWGGSSAMWISHYHCSRFAETFQAGRSSANASMDAGPSLDHGLCSFQIGEPLVRFVGKPPFSIVYYSPGSYPSEFT